MMHVSSLVAQAHATAQQFEPPVRSLMDIDFYKFTMGQLIHKHYSATEVTFKLIVRDHDINIGWHINEQELRDSLDHARSLRFKRSDLYWLRGIDLYGHNMFSESYLDFLRTFALPAYELDMTDGKIELTFTGAWDYVSPWETIALAIISELYYRSLMKTMTKGDLNIVYVRAMHRLYEKIEKLAAHPKVRFADFGQRRRHSFLWQQFVIGECSRMLGVQFTGSSNTWMAFNHDVVPIGTNAHELPMVLTALADSDAEKIDAQYKVLDLWEGMYGQGLRVFLPDTYGTDQFLKHAPEKLAEWRGFRQDSGDPISQTTKYIEWLGRHGQSGKDKLAIFSDGLDVDEMIRLQKYFEGHINTSFGWGTLLTNDFRDCAPGNVLRPFSMVCKVVEVNGRPAVKLSDNPAKATGPANEVAHYKKLFGTEGSVRQKVLV